MSLVSAVGVGVDFEGRRVLDGVDLDIEAGQQYAITGRSGSGKTTLLLVLAGLLEVSRGTVTLAVAKRDVLYVPQAPSLIPELSALDNTALALRLRGTSPPEALSRARTELERLGLQDVAEAFPSELSGGMQQRVALARATVVAPVLLLTDEPTGALDRRTGEHVLQVLHDLATLRGTALVVATHDPRTAAQLPRRLALTEGRVVA